MFLIQSRSVISEIPPCTTSTFLSMMVPSGSHRYTESISLSSFSELCLYFDFISFTNPYLQSAPDNPPSALSWKVFTGRIEGHCFSPFEIKSTVVHRRKWVIDRWSGRDGFIKGAKFSSVLPLIHDVVLVVPPVEENAAGEEQKTGEQQQQDLQTLFAAVDEVAVEYVGVFRGRQAVLKTRTFASVRSL